MPWGEGEGGGGVEWYTSIASATLKGCRVLTSVGCKSFAEQVPRKESTCKVSI